MGLPTPSLNQDAFVKISRQLPEEDTMRPHTSLSPGSEACALDHISWLPALQLSTIAGTHFGKDMMNADLPTVHGNH